MPDDLAAQLAEWGDRFEEELNRAVAEEDDSLKRSLSLLGAVEAALKLADDWKQEFARLEPSGADAVSNAGPGSYLVSGRLGALEDCAEGLREAIGAALAGKEASDG